MSPISAIAAFALVATLAGCSDDDEPASAGAPKPAAEITVAIAGSVAPDPLEARARASQFVLRQVFEPLVATIDPPFGRAGRRKGLALGFRKAAGGRVWVARLRRGVRFADGSPFNGSAVAANARRWAAADPSPLPGLVTADAPRTDRVRLIMSRRVANLPQRLKSPQLGIVSPRSLRERRGRRPAAVVVGGPSDPPGTGPFVVEERAADRLVLVRNPSWWGSGVRLGPGLERIEFIVEGDPDGRFALLAAGQVEIADQLGGADRSDRRSLRRDPLLAGVKAPRSLLGAERSLRGLDRSAPGTPLSGAWLTAVNQPRSG